MKDTLFKIHLLPFEVNRLTDTKAMPKHHCHQRLISEGIAGVFSNRLDDQVDLIVQLDERQAALAAKVDRLIDDSNASLAAPQQGNVNSDVDAMNVVLASVAEVEARMTVTLDELQRQIIQQQQDSAQAGTVITAAAMEKQSPYDQRDGGDRSEAVAMIAALRAELDVLRTTQAAEQQRPCKLKLPGKTGGCRPLPARTVGGTNHKAKKGNSLTTCRKFPGG